MHEMEKKTQQAQDPRQHMTLWIHMVHANSPNTTEQESQDRGNITTIKFVEQ